MENLIIEFYKALDNHDFKRAYKFVSPDVFGSYEYFSSEKSFGNIKSVTIDTVYELSSYFFDDDSKTAFYVSISQENNQGEKDDYKLFLFLSNTERPKITGFKVLPSEIKSNYSVNKLARKVLPDSMMSYIDSTRKYTLYWIKNGEKLTYNVFQIVYGDDYYTVTLLLSYKHDGEKLALVDFKYLETKFVTEEAYVDNVFALDDYGFILIYSGGSHATAKGGFYELYSPWFDNVCYTEVEAYYIYMGTFDIYSGSYIENIRMNENGGKIIFAFDFIRFYQYIKDLDVSDEKKFRYLVKYQVIPEGLKLKTLYYPKDFKALDRKLKQYVSDFDTLAIKSVFEKD